MTAPDRTEKQTRLSSVRVCSFVLRLKSEQHFPFGDSANSYQAFFHGGEAGGGRESGFFVDAGRRAVRAGEEGHVVRAQVLQACAEGGHDNATRSAYCQSNDVYRTI